MTAALSRKADEQPKYVVVSVRLSAADQDLKDWVWSNPRMAGLYLRRGLRAELIRAGELPGGAADEPNMFQREHVDQAQPTMAAAPKTLVGTAALPDRALAKLADPEPARTPKVATSEPVEADVPVEAVQEMKSSPLDALPPDQLEALLAAAVARVSSSSVSQTVLPEENQAGGREASQLSASQRELLENMTRGL